jgi:hypothetical protein
MKKDGSKERHPSKEIFCEVEAFQRSDSLTERARPTDVDDEGQRCKCCASITRWQVAVQEAIFHSNSTGFTPCEGLAARAGGDEAATGGLEEFVEGGARDAPLGAAPTVFARPSELFGEDAGANSCISSQFSSRVKMCRKIVQDARNQWRDHLWNDLSEQAVDALMAISGNPISAPLTRRCYDTAEFYGAFRQALFLFGSSVF